MVSLKLMQIYFEIVTYQIYIENHRGANGSLGWQIMHQVCQSFLIEYYFKYDGDANKTYSQTKEQQWHHLTAHVNMWE